MERRRRLLIVEDHVLVSDALVALLGARPQLEIAGVASDARGGRHCVAQLNPDIIIVDFLLTDGTAIDLLRYVREEGRAVRTIVLTSLRDVFAANEAFAAGAAGYVLKAQPLEDLVQAIEEVAAGRRYVSPLIAKRLAEAGRASSGQLGLDRLSRREREILRLIVGGLTSAEVSSRLNISMKTIDTHRSNMYRKLGLRNTVDLVRFAMLHGLAVSVPGDVDS